MLYVGSHDGTVQWKNGCLESLENDRWAMNSKRLAVFAAPRPCTDGVKVVAMGTFWSLTQLTVGVE